jgi:bacillithiol system protein YtxJ
MMFMQNRGVPWAGQIKNNADIDEWMERAEHIPIGLYKHDSKNMISIMNMGSLKHNWCIDSNQIEMYALDSHLYKSAGATFCSVMGIRNESAQLVILYKDKMIYHASLGNISVPDIQAVLDKHYPLAEENNSDDEQQNNSDTPQNSDAPNDNDAPPPFYGGK